ncbi:MAG: AmmeMemoRadiSam system protein B, partial [Thermoanaerobaculia bacterium]|nr:AmmeMemoRadiSam system protein B [Thermoanaerobaculia bacterium]
DAAVHLASLPQVVSSDLPHEREHALEVELPFLQVALERFELVPLVVGDATPEEVAAVLDRLWGGEETLIVVSTDLSHFLDAATAAARDRATADAIVALDVDGIAAGDACGRNPLRGLLLAARRRGLTVSELDLRSSGDTAGGLAGKDRVVGYGAFALA